MSAKTKNLIRYESDRLDVYRRMFPLCQYGCGRAATDIHEMFSAGRRHMARQHHSCILHLCRPCHDKLQYAPKAKQLAVKLWSCPQMFDLLEFNRLNPGRDVTMPEIDAYMPEVN